MHEEHHILLPAYDALSVQQRQVATSLAASPSAVEAELLHAVLGERLDGRQLSDNLRELERRGLIFRERSSLSMHPVCRSFFYDRAKDARNIHDRYRAALATHAERADHGMDLMWQMAYHKIRSTDPDNGFNAIEHFRRSAGVPAVFVVQLRELLLSFFAQGEDAPPSLLSPNKRSGALKYLGDCNFRLGRTRRALDQYKRSMRVIGASRFRTTDAMYNIGQILTHMGRLDEADQQFRQSERLFRSMHFSNEGDCRLKIQMVVSWLSRLNGIAGRPQEADRLLKEARDLICDADRDDSKPWVDVIYLELLYHRGRYRQAVKEGPEIINRARTGFKNEYAWPKAVIMKNLCQVLAVDGFEQSIDLEPTERELHDALLVIRSKMMTDLEPFGLLAQARLRMYRNELDGAAAAKIRSFVSPPAMTNSVPVIADIRCDATKATLLQPLAAC